MTNIAMVFIPELMVVYSWENHLFLWAIFHGKGKMMRNSRNNSTDEAVLCNAISFLGGVPRLRAQLRQ